MCMSQINTQFHSLLCQHDGIVITRYMLPVLHHDDFSMYKDLFTFCIFGQSVALPGVFISAGGA